MRRILYAIIVSFKIKPFVSNFLLGRRSIPISVLSSLTVILFTNCMIVIQLDNILIGNTQRCPIHIDLCIGHKQNLTVSGHGSFGDLINHSDSRLFAVFGFNITPGASDIDSFFISRILYIFADSF